MLRVGVQPDVDRRLSGARAARAKDQLQVEDLVSKPRLERCAIGGIDDEDTEDDDGLVAGLAGAERGHAASGGRISSAGVLYRLPQRPNARGIINAIWSRTFMGGLKGRIPEKR